MSLVWPVWMGSSIQVSVWLYPKLSVITLQDLLPAFFCHLVVGALQRQQLVTESLELHLDQEIERRESERRDRRRR